MEFFQAFTDKIIYVLKAKPPVDLHWFFEISIRTEKKFQLLYTEFFF